MTEGGVGVKVASVKNSSLKWCKSEFCQSIAIFSFLKRFENNINIIASEDDLTTSVPRGTKSMLINIDNHTYKKHITFYIFSYWLRYCMYFYMMNHEINFLFLYILTLY